MKVKNRLKKNEDFDNTIHKGRAYKTTNLAMFVLPNSVGYARVGISVQTKLGKANKRNKARRQIKAILGNLLDLHIANDYVFIIYKGYNSDEFVLNQKLVTELISRLDK